MHAELLKLGIDVSQSTVSKYMVRHRKPPSQSLRTFLENHVKQLISVDFFVVPTIDFKLLFVFLVLAHDRRRVVHFNVTEHSADFMTSNRFPVLSSSRVEVSEQGLADLNQNYQKLQCAGQEDISRDLWSNPHWFLLSAPACTEIGNGQSLSFTKEQPERPQ